MFPSFFYGNGSVDNMTSGSVGSGSVGSGSVTSGSVGSGSVTSGSVGSGSVDPEIKKIEGLFNGGAFINVRYLDKGGFGSVYLAQDKAYPGTFYAVKRQAYDKKTLKKLRFYQKAPKRLSSYQKTLRELNLYHRMDSPFILKCHGFTPDPSDDSYCYMFFEYIKGVNLFVFFRNFVPSLIPLAIKVIIAQIILAIEDVHAENIMHRDIKNGNFMITTEGCIKLIDFGFAKDMAAQQNSGEITYSPVGAPVYTAPELFVSDKRRKYDKTIDYWSLGVLIFRMIEGKFPFPTGRGITESDIRTLPCPKLSKGPLHSIVSGLLQIGGVDRGLYFQRIKSDPYFYGIDWPGIRSGVVPMNPLILKKIGLLSTSSSSEM